MTHAVTLHVKVTGVEFTQTHDQGNEVVDLDAELLELTLLLRVVAE